MLMIISIALLCCGVYSCGGDEDESPIQPPVEQPTSDKQPTGEITFSVEGNGNGEGTPSSPAVVETGDTLDMTINQKSSYTDSDGSVYVCEPKASIRLFADSNAVIYTKNFKTLADVKEISLKNAEKENGEALQRKTLQTFSIGGKEVTFDLMHEIYRHVNSKNTMIEMPYIKVNAAEYGATSTEEGAQTRAGSALASVTNMRIKPHMPVTRGAVVDSTMYDVSVAFNVELQTVHTKEPQSKTLSFEINFTAVVESTTEYPDPTLGFSYSLEILGGTTSTASPFVYSSGETLALKWVGNVKYDYFSITNRNMEEFSYEATANANLIVSKDTVWVEDVDELEKVVTGKTEASVTDVNDAKLHTGKKSFTIGGEQKVDFNWNYQAYQETEIEGVKVALPYMTLSEPQLVSVQKTEVPNAKIAGKKAKVYELSLRFKQDIVAENTPQPVSESVEYIVKYIGAVELKLLEVKYRKAYEWYEPHDNLHLRNQYILYKDSIFSDGSTRTVETFTMPYAKWGGVYASPEYPDIPSTKDTLFHRYDGIDFFFHKRIRVLDEAYLTPFIVYVKTGVPDLSKLSVTEPTDDCGTGEAGENPENYRHEVYDTAYNPENPQNGWYVKPVTRIRYVDLSYDGQFIRQYKITPTWYDHFCYQDGQKFDFLEFAETVNWNFKQENTTMHDGTPAIVFTLECNMNWCGKEFYWATVDSVYQRK